MKWGTRRPWGRKTQTCTVFYFYYFLYTLNYLPETNPTNIISPSKSWAKGRESCVSHWEGIEGKGDQREEEQRLA